MSLEHVGVLALIFVARCTDVTMGVFRILMVVKGRKNIAALLGFFEVMVFLSVMSIILGGGKELTVSELIAYCGGYAAGNLVGSYLEQKLTNSYVSVEIIAEKNEGSETMVRELRAAGFGTTVILGEGRSGVRMVVKVICSRKSVNRVRDISSAHGGFVIVADIKGVQGGGHFTGTGTRK
ncbi:MAG: DUF5698 domain-containing protein [Planctomycetota bacterium]|jgi:uncharacterized protein YebE (UPF0316 family)|nr:DUF5698 domain-containing protein [Planctomycetota bacterium]